MNEPQLDRIAGEPANSLGKRLSKARKARGWTLGYAASQLRLPEATVEMLESDDYGRLPAEVYVKGYLRNYARLLRLPPEDVVTAYLEQRGAGPLEPPANNTQTGRASPLPAAPRSSHRPPQRATASRRDARQTPPSAGSGALRWVAAAVLLGLIATWWWPDEQSNNFPAWLTELRSTITSLPAPDRGDRVEDSTDLSEPGDMPEISAAPSARQPMPVRSADQDASSTMPAQPETPPAVAEPDAPKEPVPDTLVLRFEDVSWATVIDADGKRLLHATGEKGAVKTLTGKAPFNLTIGRIANVGIEFNGQPVFFPNAKNRATERFSVPLKTAN